MFIVFLYMIVNCLEPLQTEQVAGFGIIFGVVQDCPQDN